jgi:hypothetical protein
MWIFNEMYLFTAKAQKTQRFDYFLFSGETPRKGGIPFDFKSFKGWPPENKKSQLYKVNLIARGNYICHFSIHQSRLAAV